MEAIHLRALELATGLPPTATNIARVARATTPPAAAWAFGQGELRDKARAKFARASEMLFVREALEQATHERVADYHASLFPVDEMVVDMTVGIGADLIALAKRGTAVGYELNHERAECARWNLAALGLATEVMEADSVVNLDSEARYALCDPARRIDGRRTLDPDEFSPNPKVVAEKMAAMRRGVIKLSPLLPDDFLAEIADDIRFVSYGRECREALAVVGSERHPGIRAVQVESGEELEAQAAPGGVDAPAEYLFDVDPAAVRAHGLGTLCARHGLRPLGDGNGYLTGGDARSPWMRSYRVIDSGSWDPKRVKACLRQLNAATPEIKQRGTRQELIALRKTLRSEGDRQVVLILYPLGPRIRFVLADPTSP